MKTNRLPRRENYHVDYPASRRGEASPYGGHETATAGPLFPEFPRAADLSSPPEPEPPPRRGTCGLWIAVNGESWKVAASDLDQVRLRHPDGVTLGIIDGETGLTCDCAGFTPATGCDHVRAMLALGPIFARLATMFGWDASVWTAEPAEGES